MRDAWVKAARRRLVELRGGRPGWSYRQDTSPAAEPTALAGLALLAGPGGPPTDAERAEARSAADWLVTIQQPDGSVRVSTDLAGPGWPTPYGLLLWSALGDPAYNGPRRRALDWLLAEKGKTAENPGDGVIGHDPTLAAWPWVADTHSWVEPTALALMALNREGLREHQRTLEGLLMLRDRAVPTGGWNYGNSAVFGRSLRPQPGPTGLALLALGGSGGPSFVAERAIRYLLDELATVRAALSLGWGVLGLRAWGRRPETAGLWLAESAAETLDRPDAAPRLAVLLLARGERSLDLLGVD